MKSTTQLLFALFLFPFLLPAQQVSVKFQVNMNYQMELGRFQTNDVLDIAGTFNNWGDQSQQLTDDNQDGIYDITISSFAIGEAIAFKFRRNGSWNGTEEFPNGGPNRTYVVQPTNNQILVWYNNEAPPNIAPIANFSSREQRIVSEGTTIFQDVSGGNVENRTWLFEGGIPRTAIGEVVQVEYPNSGRYDVSLIVENAFGKDTLEVQNYLRVDERTPIEEEWWNDAVFYEIFVRSFKDSDGDGIGDFKGLTAQLDYLNDGDPNTNDDLGIKGIWLMPIHDSPSYHGYDVKDYTSIEPDFGTMADFDEFLEEAHKRGIRVIIDYVMNHTSSEHPWFLNSQSSANAEKRNWYRWKTSNPNYNGPWGQQVWHRQSTGYYYGLFWGGMPDLNYNEPAVHEALFDAADFWLEKGVDGFRLDAVKFLYETENGRQLEDLNATFQFWQDFRTHYTTTKPDAFTVGEAWTSTDKVVKYVEDEGINFCFEFDLAGEITNAINSSNTRWLRSKMEQTYSIYPNQQYGTFLSNHDQNRIIHAFGNSQNKMKAAAAIYLTLPGIPFIYYGEEIGMKGQKPDEYIRTPMLWDNSIHAGFTTGSPWIELNNDHQSNNVVNQAQQENSLLNWYKKLIQIRNQEAALRRGAQELVDSDDASILAFTRLYEGELILVVTNVSGRQINNFRLDLSALDLAAQTYEATELIENTTSTLRLDGNAQINNLRIGGYGTQIYKFKSITTSTESTSPRTGWQLHPNPAKTQIVLEYTDSDWQPSNYVLSDISGQILQQGQLIHSIQSINIRALPAGMYILAVARDGQQQQLTFVKE